MPRPARAIWVTRTYARRRHRSWMLSMTLASLGWGTWWTVLFLKHFAPSIELGRELPSFVSTAFAIIGFLVALLTLRARRAWLYITLVPLLGNASLFAMPWLAAELWPHG